jgi:hypothetical protein
MPAPLLNIIVTMALCYAAWGFFFAYLRPRGLDYARRPLWTTAYFAVIGIGFAALFWDRLITVVSSDPTLPLAVLGVFLALQTLWYIYFPTFTPEPTEYLKKYPDRDYLSLNWRRLAPKSADIFTQQVFIVLLVLFLKDAGLSTLQILPVFGALFAILHIPLMVLEWGRWPAWVFGGAVVSFSVIFPLLILHVEYGFIYNLIIHWLFYTGTASIFWIQHALHINSKRTD